MNFPYIQQIHVNSCFTYQNLDIPKVPLIDFKHIILTGKNGSGKTTILNTTAKWINYFRTEKRLNPTSSLKSVIRANQNHSSRKKWEAEVANYELITPFFLGNEGHILQNSEEYIFSFFKAHRRVELENVSTVTREEEFITKIRSKNDDNFSAQFKQYLVNKKVYEAFDFMNDRKDKIRESSIFFDSLKNTLRAIFKDEQLELEFIQESFEFYLTLSDKRKITFNQLSEGFSAFLSIIIDLTMRVDLLRKVKNDYTLNPAGIVLIDEPETHFHLSMQYELLPLLTNLFPNIQLIIATHSPAIISSLKNAIVYDLTSQQEVSDWLLGSSYSELMIRHFGLENEFSPIADKILLDVNLAIQENSVSRLKEILIENEKYLTPSLKLEIESQIIKLENSLKQR